MGIFDLFGSPVKSNDKTFEEEYQEYIQSAAWKRKRDHKIELIGGACEICHKSKWSVKLEVHHLTYDHFKNERMEELQVLCHACHMNADKKREIVVTEKRANSAIIIGFENWMDSGNNKGWRKKNDRYLSARWEKFLRSISKRGKEYDIPYWRSPEW